MLDAFQASLARKKLAEWEWLFKKYADGREAWPDVYKEYFLVKQVQSVSSLFYWHLCELSHEYPVTHYYFCSIKKSVEAGCHVYAPEGVQTAVYELSRISQKIRLNDVLDDKKAYITLARSLSCSNKVLRYYREAEYAHKYFAEYLEFSLDTSMTAKAAYLLSGVSSDPSIGKNDLIKFQQLELPIRYSLEKNVEHMIQKGESHTLEFKAAFVSEGKRRFDKKSIENQRLKEIVAFLNADGGDLLIGVDDDGSIHGIDNEITEFYHSTIDNYGLSWSSLLKDRIAFSAQLGAERKTGFITEALVSHRSVSISGNRLYMFSCKPRDDNAIFYLKERSSYKYFERNNVSIKKFEDKELEDYLRLKRGCK